LQVDSDKQEIKKIWYAVDASTYIIDKAVKEKVDMLITHHGLYRWDVLTTTGFMFQRLKRLIKNDICSYSVHLPLDAHKEVGNNIGIVKSFIAFFKLKKYRIEEFGFYHWQSISFAIRFQEKIPFKKLEDFFKHMWFENVIYDFANKKYINSVAIVSGGGGSALAESVEKKYDIFLIGEAKHSECMRAKECGMSLWVGWHYETETIWVKLLAQHLAKKFKVKIVFLDEKY
jgi:dinuclear metal center YbgI/SA1388 family protein